MKLIKFAVLLLVFSANTAFAANFQEGESFHRIVPAQPTSTEGKIEVVELFSYACSHCHRFEPHIERWLKTLSDDVVFVRMPAIFNDRLEMYARAFYAAEALGELDKLHQPFFDAIHLQKRAMNNQASIIALAAENGIDQAAFEKAFRSFSVDSKVRRAKELGRRYAITSTPSMVVNGKYRSDPGITGGFRGLLKVVDHLVEKEQTSN